MTKEETIKILEELLWHLQMSSAKSANDYRDALREAMKMLSQKGRWIELPCEIGTKLYRVTHPYRQPAKVTEFTAKNFRTVGKRHRIQIEVQATNVPATNWMYFSDFYTTKEEAEKALADFKKEHPFD